MHSVGYQILHLPQRSKVVLGLDVVRVRNVHSGDQAAERLDTSQFPDQHASLDSECESTYCDAVSLADA